MSIRTYTAKDGLPSSYIFNAYQDKLDYLWVGSPEGLSRFDGKHFTNYGLAAGLPDTRAIGGFMDSRHRYWAATAKGVAEFKGDRFITYPLSDSQVIGWVSRVLETKEGQVWALTDAGVYQFSLNKWEKLQLYQGYENHRCYNVVETEDGLYINYGNLLLLRKPDNTYKVIGDSKDVAYYYYNLFLSGNDLFLSTLDGVFEIKNQRLIKLPGVLGRLKGFNIFFRDSKKRFWTGRYKMGIELLAKGDTSHFIPIIKPSIDFLPQGISEDRHGNIWVGSGNGLIKISELGFTIFDLSSITGNTVLRNVLQPPTGPLLINNGSMTFHTFENDVFANKKLRNRGSTPLPNNELIIDEYAFDDKGRYWYILRGLALVMQEGNNVYEQSRQLAHLSNEAFDVLFDGYRKKILVAVLAQKLPCQYNDTSYSLLAIANNITVTGNIRRLHQCVNGTILFNTDRGLIYSIDKKNVCKLQLNEFNGNGVVVQFCNDPNGDVWILYTGRGIRRYSWQEDTLLFKEQLSMAQGLPSDNVSSLCFDNKGNLWASTPSHVAVFSKKLNAENGQTYQIGRFFNPEDLQTGDAVDARITKDGIGNMWFFSRSNLICFSPDKINYTSVVPSVVIENIELNLRKTNWADYADSLSGIFQLPYRLTLSHKNNTLGIYFKGISSAGTEGIKYSYQLEGLENLWSVPSSNDFVSFVKLLPGKYTFKIRARLGNADWCEPAEFSFQIKKAFWQTWWFYLLTGIVIVTGIYVLFRYQLRQKLNLLEMRNRISQDLHDEIGASMSGINLLSQMAAEKLDNDKPNEASAYLLKVKNYSQDVIEKLSDMVWVFNPQNDSIEKLLQRLKSFTVSIAASKNIKIHFLIDKESELINLTIRERKAVYLISKEAFNNIFKYGGCSNIFYTLNGRGSKWRLRIQDDGKGFIPSEDKNGNGLKNMQARADEIGAHFSIQSQPGAGTIVTIEF